MDMLRRLAVLLALLALPSVAQAQDFIGIVSNNFPAGTPASPGLTIGDQIAYTYGFHRISSSLFLDIAGGRNLRFNNGIGIVTDAGIFSIGLADDAQLTRASAGVFQQVGNPTTTPQGYQTFAGYGGYTQLGTASEEITLSTISVTTDSTTDLLPINSEILAVTYRVTETITTSANYDIGDPTTVHRFVIASTGLVAGSTGVGLLHRQGSISTDATGPVQTAAAKIRITTNANAGAGKIRVQIYYRQYVAPTT
jgi:hypothetical protein